MIVRGRYLIDSTGRTIERAEVVVEGRRIVDVRREASGPAAEDSDVIDLGCAALLPGFVNAHSHLELTRAHVQLGARFRFTDWIREVIRATSEWNEADFESSLRDGLQKSVESGTTTLGDISRGACDARAYDENGLRVRLFHEVIGFDPSAAEERMQSLKDRIGRTASDDKLLAGISPHTPYTVSERLLRRCAGLAHREGRPLCIHLAETPAELEFLGAGTGEILEFRKEFGLRPEWKPPRTSPARYVRHLGLMEKPITIIHGNYIGEEDFDIIALSASSVVFCPRSHRYFDHREHPFLEMLGHGINVALGTDSLVSSPSLSILDEMKFLRDSYPEIDPAVLLRMATVNGYKALGLPADSALLARGGRADLVGIALSEDEIERFDNPLEAIFSGGSKVIF